MVTNEFRDVPSKTVEKLGFIPRWLVCGPFQAGDEGEAYRLYRMGRFDVPDADPIGGELFIEPTLGVVQRSDSVPGKETIWSSMEATSPHIALSSAFPNATHGVAYAASYLLSPADELFICDFRPQMVGRMIVNHRVASPDRGLVQIPLKAGRNLLMLKILGSARRGASWGAVCGFRRAKLVGSSGVATTGPRSTGFFRGSADSPEVEIEFALANVSDSDIFDVATLISSDDLGSEISRATEVLRAGETRSILYGLPVAKGKPQKVRVSLEVSAKSERSTVSDSVEMAPIPASDATVHLGVGFHCDPVWTNTQSMYNDVSLHNVTQYLNFCRADPGFKVIFHELDYLKPYLDFYPGDRDYLTSLVRQGRVILGGSYSEPNEKNVSGEQLIRNILYGKLFATSLFGVNPRVYHPWDVFGHVVQLSQILKKTGNIGVVWSKTVKGFPPVFRHMSLDGSTVAHRRLDYGFTTSSFAEMRERAYAGLKEMESLGHGSDLRMDCSDFKSPTAWKLGRTNELKLLLPKIQAGDPVEFFEDVLKDESHGVLLPVTSRDPSQYHIGTSQSRIELKIANRLGEAGLQSAESICTWASLLGAAYPDLALDKAWRQLLFNSHHDAITGTSCDKSYLDMLQGYREALGLIGQCTARALDDIASKVDLSASEGIPIIVFNTLNWVRTSAARARITFQKPVASFALSQPNGKDLPFCLLSAQEDGKGIHSAEIEFVARDVPAMGYATYQIRPSTKGSLPRWKARQGDLSIENQFYKVTVDPSRGGGISSILDKELGKEVIPAGGPHLGNEIAILKEKNDRNEPSWELYTTGETMFSAAFPAEVSVQECGPASRIQVAGRLGEYCELLRQIVLRKGLKSIEFTTEIRDYRGRDDLFVALFPTSLAGAAPTYEERFGAIVKHRGRKSFDYKTWRGDAYSDCVIHSSQNFFDHGSTTKIRFVDYEARTVSSCPLGSVLLVMPHSKEIQITSTHLQRALASRGVLTTPWFDDDDAPRRGNLPHLDSTEAAGRNEDLPNTNFRISMGVGANNSYSISLLRGLDKGSLEGFTDRVRRLGFDFLVLSDRNAPAGWDSVPVLIIEASDPQSMEKAVDFLVDGLRSGDLIIPHHANHIGPVQVEDYGVSVLNRGNMANTVEPDGTMSLFLTHTSNWSRIHLEEEFIPERKDHVFHYALYPHGGSWREAGSYRLGWEYNLPLLCVQATPHKGVLPPVLSFMQVSTDNVVVVACKPVGNPVAAFQARGSDASRGIIIRVYEAEGRRVEATFRSSVPLEGAWRTDPLENRLSSLEVRNNSFTVTIEPFSIETFELKPVPTGEKRVAGPEVAEVVQPVYTRYWRENLGPAPIGYQAVAISIQGSPVTEAGGRGTTINRVSVNVVNNYVDQTIVGHAVLEAPEGWRVQPETIWYEVPPLGHRSYDVILSFSGIRRTGLFRARLSHDGQTYEDVIEIGEQSKLTYAGGGSVYQDVLKVQIERALTWSIFQEANGVSVRVENPYNERVDGGVALIVPMEYWSPDEVGDYSLAEMAPGVQALHLAPKSFQVLKFDLRGRGERDPRFWAYAKLFYMGRTEYRRVR